jgi:DNA integrity scanning protein DisA with diadenylate cyclase activity
MFTMQVSFATKRFEETAKISATVVLLDIIQRLIYIRTQHFGDWIICPPSDKSYSGIIVKS